MNAAESIGLLVLFLVISFFLSGFESAILSISKVRLRHSAKKGRRGAAMLDKTLKESERLLIAILLLNAIANISAFALLTRSFVNWLDKPWGYVAAFVVSLPIYIIWVELTPKYIFKQFPLRSLILFNPILRIIQFTICPILALLAWFPKMVLRLFGVKEELPQRGSTREEFRALTTVFQREGTLDQSEVRLIRKVLDFQKLLVKDVMIPLSKTTTVPPDMPVSEILVLSVQTNFDHFPVMSATGDLIGIIEVRELQQRSSPSGTVEQYRRSLVRTDTDEYALAMIKRLRNSGRPLAAVYDKNNKPVGVVSTEEMIHMMVQMS